MILYFANRSMDILGTASTELPKGLTIVSDQKLEDVDTGVATFEGCIAFSAETRDLAENCCAVGNYLLRSHNGENGFFTIIDSELDTKSQEVTIYAEDAGLDLLNEISVAYSADKAYPISHYIEKFAYDSGFVIGINEASDLSRKLSWDGESTVAERIASVATQFDNCEVSYSFEISGLKVAKKLINIYRERGSDTGVQLRLNEEVDRIISKKTIANLATALKVEGGVPEDSETPIDLNGYSYDDGDIFLEGTYLKSRSAVAVWSRYLSESGDYTGHIMRTFSYDTTSQSELCNRAVAELRKISQIEANYEADVIDLPQDVRVGDRISIIDDDGKLYVSTRVLKLEESATKMSKKATFGEFLMQDDGINEDVARLAAQFSKSSQSATNALKIAKEAKTDAETAQTQANAAISSAANAQAKADAADAAASAASASAANAQAKAEAAEEAVSKVEEQVSSIEDTVDGANAAAEQARQAALNAETKASEAQTAAIEAKEDAADAKEQAGVAKTNSETAISKSDEAKTTAEQAIDEAAAAKATADAAKLDAEQAQKDLAEFEEDLTTLSNTMQADYARKTDLTETEAELETKISQNAAQIQSTASKVLEIDETANNAAEIAAQAQTTAAAAQAQADKATEDAEAAQAAADAAALAASAAQAEADTANAAAANAKAVADKAETDLAAAKADLATVQGRVDATEEDIAAAQQAVETAQAAADKANADAATATQKATVAQTTADNAVANASKAQTAADNAATAAALAQQTAEEAKGDASAAQQTADEAATAAAAAQQTADTAKANATAAQTKANEAAAAAATAQQAANDADAKAAQAAADLAAAEQNLVDVTSRVDAAEEEVEAAQAAVVAAQAKADEANAAAVAAQSTADTAKADAAKAQTDADNAKKAADDAQAAAEAAQNAADDAQAAVDALAVRVTKTETDIIQTSEQILLLATKEEVAETLGGYYTKLEADAAIKVSADNVKSTVSSTYQTKAAMSDYSTTAQMNAAINQKADEISLSVSSTYQTKAAMSDYSTTAQMNAAIKVESDRITTVVDEQTSQGGRLTALAQKVDGISLKYTDSNGNETSFALTNGAIDITLLKDQIDDAATTATNFISLGSGGGIEVGNKSNGSWSGYRTQMAADAFNILDASNNVVATYGTDTIKLGLNSTSSVIYFCGDKSAISYDSANSRTKLTTDAFLISAKKDGYGTYAIFKDGEVGFSYSAVSSEPTLSTNFNIDFKNDTVEINGFSSVFFSANGKTYFDLGDVYLRNSDLILTSYNNLAGAPAGKIIGESAGGSWYRGRDNALLKSTSGTGTTSYFPVIDAKCNAGDWSIGTLGSDLYFVHTTDSDYGTGTNNTKKVRITSDGMLDAQHGINIPNNTWLTIQNASGTDRHCIVMNASNQYFFGYSGLTQAEGASYFDGNAVYLRSNATIQFYAYNGQGYGTILIGAQGTDRGLELRPATTNTCSLGWTSGRWKYAYVKQIYTTNSVSVDSDRRLKKDISYDFASIDKVIDSLNPAIYKLKADEDEKIRFGFVAQDVEQAFIEAGLNPDDYAVISKDEDGVMLSLGYTETNALLWHRQQQLEKRIAELEKLTA